MGCDIHGCIEYSSKYDETEYRDHFCDLSYISRNYTLFALMADVRNYDRFELIPVSKPKGLPNDISWKTSHHVYIHVNPNITEPDWNDREIPLEMALKWLQKGHSKLVRECEIDGVTQPKVITDPDTHSHSWMHVEELEEVKRRLIKHKGGTSLALNVIIAAMKELDKQDNVVKSRFIFWFDN